MNIQIHSRNSTLESFWEEEEEEKNSCRGNALLAPKVERQMEIGPRAVWQSSSWKGKEAQATIKLRTAFASFILSLSLFYLMFGGVEWGDKRLECASRFSYKAMHAMDSMDTHYHRSFALDGPMQLYTSSIEHICIPRQHERVAL